MVEQETIREFLNYLSDDDRKEQINAIKQTSSIIDAIGADSSKENLLPMLEEKVKYDFEDEVLLYLCEELPSIYKSLGSENVDSLISILDKLLTSEESVIRETSVAAIRKIGSSLKDDEIETLLLPMVLNLTETDWFPGKCSASALFDCCYTRVNTQFRALLRRKCQELVQDESPMVRKTTAIHLATFIDVIEKDFLRLEFVPVFDNLAKDDQDSVRVASVKVGISLAKKMIPWEIQEMLLDTFLGLANDVSWKVKYQFASEIINTQLAFGPELTRKHLVHVFSSLSKDYESQVREEIAKNVSTFCQHLQETYKNTTEDAELIDPIITSTFFEIIQSLDEDISENVVEELAYSLSTMGKLLGKKYSKQFLLPIFSSKVSSDSDKIKECVVLNINELIKVIGYEEVAEVVQAIIGDLRLTTVWRTRRNLFVTLNSIIRHVDSIHFNEHLLPIYKHLLSDHVAAVRRTGTLILPLLIRTYGNQWAHDHLVPILNGHLNQPYNYLLTFPLSVNEILMPFMDSNYLKNYLEKHRGQLPEISVLCEMLKEDLEANDVTQMLVLCKPKEYFNDDMLTYAENVFTKIRYDSTEESTEQYLTTTLKLVLTTFLSCMKKLSENRVVNVRLRALNSLEHIHEFWALINQALSRNDFQEVLDKTTEEEKHNIRVDIQNFVDDHKLKLSLFQECARMDGVSELNYDITDGVSERSGNTVEIVEVSGNSEEKLIFDLAESNEATLIDDEPMIHDVQDKGDEAVDL